MGDNNFHIMAHLGSCIHDLNLVASTLNKVYLLFNNATKYAIYLIENNKVFTSSYLELCTNLKVTY